MKKLQLSNELFIKKLNPNNPLDTGLIEELEKDETINGENGYLWPLSTSFQDRRYLLHENLLKSCYTIYHKNCPIGFLEISDIFKTPNMCTVDISYALHKTARKKGYMQSVLTEISEILLEEYSEVDTITLIIDPKNTSSRKTAKSSGFITDGRSEKEYQREGYVVYQKVRK